MPRHWQEAQEIQRGETGTNAVFLANDQAAITGNEEVGWLIVTPEQAREARTSEGVNMMLRELYLPLYGWSSGKMNINDR